AAAQFFTPPASAASCDNDCSTVASKLSSCDGVPGFPALPELPELPKPGEFSFPELPKLGDAALNNCLCSNETINAYRSCENCRSIHKAVMNTDRLIADCRRVDPSRTYLATNSTSNTRSMATETNSSGVSVVVAIIAVGLAISLS
ncbi:hypothetical protein BGZ52_004368, partial [Haplosporangium bisporale]